MRFRGTLALFLVFAGLGAYVYFGEYRGSDERQKQEEAKKKLFSIEEKDVAEITLEYPDQTITAVRRAEKSWEITTPPGLEADSEEWSSLAGNLAQVQKEESVTTQPGDLAQYGLSKPPIKVTAKLQGAEPGRVLSVLFGLENPRKTFLYAKLADKDEVFLTPTSASGSFKKSLTDLRNKKVLDVDAENVDSLKITVAGRPEIELQKSGTDWRLKEPVDTRGDSSEVNAFVSSIQFARASDFADASVDPKKAGLDPPEVKVTLHDQKTGMDRVLLLGKPSTPPAASGGEAPRPSVPPAPSSPSGDARYFARDMARPAIVIIGKDILEKAQRPVFDWRDKSIAQFSRDMIDEAEIFSGAETVLLKKVGADWQLADGRKVQQDKIFDMLSSLELDRALEILDSPAPLAAYGLDAAKLRVILRVGGKEALTLGFGKDKGTDGIYAKSSSTPAVLTVPRTLYDKFSLKASDLVESPPAPQPPAK